MFVGQLICTQLVLLPKFRPFVPGPAASVTNYEPLVGVVGSQQVRTDS